MKYRADIDGLRAIAISLVLAFHVAPFAAPGGFVGVDVFFVISGYLITGILARAMYDERFTFAWFYFRRIKRLFPALAIVLAATLIAGNFVLLSADYKTLGAHVAASAGFVVNILLFRESGYFDESAGLKPLLHLWSLGVEEQFYVVWPMVLLASIRWHLRPLLVAAAIGLVSFASNVLTVASDPAAAFYLPQNRFWELMIGACAWTATDSPNPWFAGTYLRFRDAASIVGVALIALSAATLSQYRSFPGWWALLPTVGSVAVVLSGPQAWINRTVLSQKSMVWLGKISYPLYLWHWPLLSFLYRFSSNDKPSAVLRTRVLAIVISILLAWLTHIAVERRANWLFQRRPEALVAAASISMLALGLAGFMHLPPQSPQGEVSQLARLESFLAQNPPEKDWRRRTCFLFPEDAASQPEAFIEHGCDGGSTPKRPVILLAGDSTAAHLYPGLVGSYGDSLTIAQFTTAFCVPLIEHMKVLENRTATTKCQEANDFIFSRAVTLKPDLIVVSADFSIYEDEPGFAYPGFDEAFAENMQSLRKRTGSQVVVIGQLPVWRNGLPRFIADRIRKRLPIPEFSGDTLNQAVFAIDARLKKLPWGPGVEYISMIDNLCRATECRALTNIGDEFPANIIAFDRIHLTEAGASFAVKEIISKTLSKFLSKHD
jgi:peptidoglycan/LPS O-acetylase OafA/YrhL